MITRTIIQVNAVVYEIQIVNGAPKVKEVGKYSYCTTSVPKTVNSVMKEIKKVNPNISPQATIQFDYKEVVMGITLEDFLKYAKEVERPESQKKKEGNK